MDSNYTTDNLGRHGGADHKYDGYRLAEPKGPRDGNGVNYLTWLFQWTDHPGRVFFLAIPLVCLGFGLMLYVALARHSLVEFLIWLGGVALIAFHPLTWKVIRLKADAAKR